MQDLNGFSVCIFPETMIHDLHAKIHSDTRGDWFQSFDLEIKSQREDTVDNESMQNPEKSRASFPEKFTIFPFEHAAIKVDSTRIVFASHQGLISNQTVLVSTRIFQ